jgi:hypothetical protein
LPEVNKRLMLYCVDFLFVAAVGASAVGVAFVPIQCAAEMIYLAFKIKK